MEEMKKDLQKLVKMFRDELNQTRERKSDYPKAMMTGEQMKRRTATINCGYTWCADDEEVMGNLRQRADFIMDDQRFMNFCEGYDAIACVEEVKVSGSTQVQIRINY